MSDLQSNEENYSLRYSKTGDLFEVEFHEEPSYCHVLPMAPSSREPALNCGYWMVLLFAVWSAPDITSIDTALAAVEGFNGKIQLGIRPFDQYTEMKAWCPEARGSYRSPIWLLFQEGQMVTEFHGPQSEDQLAKIFQTWFVQSTNHCHSNE